MLYRIKESPLVEVLKHPSRPDDRGELVRRATPELLKVRTQLVAVADRDVDAYAGSAVEHHRAASISAQLLWTLTIIGSAGSVE